MEQPPPSFIWDFDNIDPKRIDSFLCNHPTQSETGRFLDQYFEVVHKLFPVLDQVYCAALFQWFWSPEGWKQVHAQKISEFYPALAIIHCIVAMTARYTGSTDYEGYSFNLAAWELSQKSPSPGLEQFIASTLLVIKNTL